MRFTENRIESSKDELSLSADLPPQPKVQSQDIFRRKNVRRQKTFCKLHLRNCKSPLVETRNSNRTAKFPEELTFFSLASVKLIIG
jgi:hypothetical protein